MVWRKCDARLAFYFVDERKEKRFFDGQIACVRKHVWRSTAHMNFSCACELLSMFDAPCLYSHSRMHVFVWVCRLANCIHLPIRVQSNELKIAVAVSRCRSMHLNSVSIWSLSTLNNDDNHSEAAATKRSFHPLDFMSNGQHRTDRAEEMRSDNSRKREIIIDRNSLRTCIRMRNGIIRMILSLAFDGSRRLDSKQTTLKMQTKSTPTPSNVNNGEHSPLRKKFFLLHQIELQVGKAIESIAECATNEATPNEQPKTKNEKSQIQRLLGT